ncbi:MAG: DNA-directed RNA polymerase subunit omega [Candidatus Marinimicrobia bacterium]|nr:DNA-directed RNA polymerase subunit omega [Candidatus Neomarinimicrobiota bacterium]
MIVTLPFSELNKINDDIYKSVVIIGKRSKQVIEERQINKIHVIDEEEDFESLDSVREIEIEEYIEKDKVIVSSLKEYLEGDLEWKLEQTQDN